MLHDYYKSGERCVARQLLDTHKLQVKENQNVLVGVAIGVVVVMVS